MKLLIHSQNSTVAPLKVGNGYHNILCNGWNCLSRWWLKLIHDNKMAPRSPNPRNLDSFETGLGVYVDGICLFFIYWVLPWSNEIRYLYCGHCDLNKETVSLTTPTATYKRITIAWNSNMNFKLQLQNWWPFQVFRHYLPSVTLKCLSPAYSNCYTSWIKLQVVFRSFPAQLSSNLPSFPLRSPA